MILRYQSDKRQLARLLPWLALLFLLSGCAQAQGNAPDCHQSSCITSPSRVASSPAPGVRRVIDTWNNTHLFQTFDYDIADPQSAARRYDFVWGAELTHVAAFRSGNPDILLSYYIPFDRDWGAFPDSSTRHDLAYWQTAHPDWILYKCDRVTPAYTSGYPNVPLDFTDPAVLSWQVETYALPASQNGYDAIAADNVILQNVSGACGVYRNGRWVQRYSGQADDPRWSADVIGWLKQMQQTLHHLPHPLALISNFYVHDIPLSDPQVEQLVQYSDGLLDEDGFTNLARRDLTDSAWLQRVQFIESVQQQLKPYYIIDKFSSVDTAAIQWALACYLMAKGHASALFITGGGYGAESLYDEYNAQVGTPEGPMYQAQQVYMRDYSNGLSIVNPSSIGTYTVTLPAGKNYVNLYGKRAARSIILLPHSGLVLLLRP